MLRGSTLFFQFLLNLELGDKNKLSIPSCSAGQNLLGLICLAHFMCLLHISLPSFCNTMICDFNDNNEVKIAENIYIGDTHIIIIIYKLTP